jgi:prepilin-type N-terminal cleavage/methylation domain-containing protein
MFCKRGFTLIEVLIVVIILGILATLSVPQVTTMVRRARLAEAWTALGTVKSSLALYHLERGTYVGATLANLDITANTNNFTLTLPTLTATTYVVRATGNTSNTTNIVAEINQLGQRRYSLNGAGALPATWST